MASATEGRVRHGWIRSAGVAIAAAVIVATPAAWYQWRAQPSPAVMRLLIGAALGLLLLPAVHSAFAGKRLRLALPVLVGPPLAVAIWGLIDLRADDIWLTIATPMLWGMALLIAALLPDARLRSRRGSDPRACQGCGYDRSATPLGPCPECGTLGMAATRLAPAFEGPFRWVRTWTLLGRLRLTLWCLLGTIVGGGLALLFVRWLRTLG